MYCVKRAVHEWRGFLAVLAITLVVVMLGSCTARQKATEGTRINALTPDEASHRFLEDVEGEAALNWVRAQNQRSLAVLEGDERYQRNYEIALAIATSRETIPQGAIRGGYVYNFWQDGQHERGIWRRTTVADYGGAEPEWETLLDVDALARTEGANWVFKGIECRPPEYVDCLVSLSDGGRDAVRIREYSIRGGAAHAGFVVGGFDVPEAKTWVLWESADSLLIATDWKDDTLTPSGYPFVIKRLERGQALADAVELFRGHKDGIGVAPTVLEDASGERWFGAAVIDTFFATRYFIFDAAGKPRQLPVPRKSAPRGVFEDRFILTLEEDWMPDGQASFLKGDLVSFSWREFLDRHVLPPVELIFRPSAKQAIQGVSLTSNQLLVNLSDNVVSRVVAWTRAQGKWTAADVPLPAGGTASITFANEMENMSLLLHEGFLSPDTLYRWNSSTSELTSLYRFPDWFDASAFVVEQFEAVSRDQTRVPYFVVRKKDLEFDGQNPTLMYGYGGFQVSEKPAYSGTIGRLWLEQGGVYVLANIRGGGEFGPAWHQAGLKTRRQVVYDDFVAIAEDLIVRRITAPDKLGIMGGSGGGLLVGVVATQRPDLFSAVVCEVPLLDMLRYHLLLAGASWVDEYGSPEVAEERAFLETTSPYHNVNPAQHYPEIFFVTSTKDDRVHPAHARKMAKRFEDLGKPFLYYENVDGGHSAAANLREKARRVALEFTYLSRKLMNP